MEWTPRGCELGRRSNVKRSSEQVRVLVFEAFGSWGSAFYLQQSISRVRIILTLYPKRNKKQ